MSGNTTLTIQPPPLAITTTSLPSGTVSTAYTTTLSGERWERCRTAGRLTSGSLPPGLTLNTNSGVISGTPGAAATFSFTAQASDASNPIQTAAKSAQHHRQLRRHKRRHWQHGRGDSDRQLWYSGAWINACWFQAASNLMVTTMRAKVAAITGKYKCAIYTDINGQPSRLLRVTARSAIRPTVGRPCR